MDGLDAITETAGAAAVEMAVSAVVERGGKVAPCPNCKTPMIGAFCLACGQARDIHRRSVFGLLHDFFSDIVNFDSRILRTARALLFQPGELSLAFHEGRTQRYVPPVRLYLFVSLIFFIALSMSGIAIMQLAVVGSSHVYTTDKDHNVVIITNGVRSTMKGFKADDKGNVYLNDRDSLNVHVRMAGMKADGKMHNDVTTRPYFFKRIGAVKGGVSSQVRAILDDMVKENDAETKKSPFGEWLKNRMEHVLQTLATDPAAINVPLTEWIPRVLFILLPLFALLLAVFYWRQRRQFYFVDHLVFSLGIHTFAFVALLAAAVLAQFASDGVVIGSLFVALAVYLLFAMKRFYRQSWLWTSLKFATVGILYCSFILGPALAGIILVSLLHV